MEWTQAAEQAHGAAVAAVYADTARRYGEDVALEAHE